MRRTVPCEVGSTRDGRSARVDDFRVTALPVIDQGFAVGCGWRGVSLLHEALRGRSAGTAAARYAQLAFKKKQPSFNAVVSETSLASFSSSCKVDTETPLRWDISLRVRPRLVRRVRRRWRMGISTESAGMYRSGSEVGNTTKVLPSPSVGSMDAMASKLFTNPDPPQSAVFDPELLQEA